MATSPQPASEGRIVHVSTPGVSHCQPAIVVQAWGDGTGALNLLVFRDGSNDAAYMGGEDSSALVAWATSVGYAEEPIETQRTWHWPERVG
jgi:hypothetical protein